jgi:hypothetical protein
MTQAQALVALDNLVKEKKAFKNSIVYKTALAAINSPDTPIRCGKNTGSGRFATLQTWQFQTGFLLDLIGVQYSKGNDAPKGGRCGDNIAVHFVDNINSL